MTGVVIAIGILVVQIGTQIGKNLERGFVNADKM